MSVGARLFDLNGKRVTVMGLGLFGGGLGAVRFLVDRGARVTVTDLKSETELAESLAQLDGCALEAVHLQKHHEPDFRHADLVVVSPAVRRDNRYLQLARQSNVPLTSEICLFWQFNRGRIVGVTGSNGKSTTAAMVHSILKAAGIGCRLGGNIGGSLLPLIDDIQPSDWSVLELSSFQLDDLDRLPASPDVAVVTNFSPNHLDWHHSLSHYRKAKQTILRWQMPHSTAVLNSDDADVSGWKTNHRQLWFGMSDPGRDGVFLDSAQVIIRDRGGQRRLAIPDWLKLPGRHNLQNALAATCAALAVGADRAAVQQGLQSFTPLEHRLQPLGEVAQRTFYNDSLSTTPESMVAAVEAFSSPVVLLAGGYDKQLDLSSMAEAIVQKTKAVALMGQTAEVLSMLIEQRCDTHPKQECASLSEAFQWACNQSAPGDVVLLSPGCASYDWFPNFRERGKQFVELVNRFSSSLS